MNSNKKIRIVNNPTTLKWARDYSTTKKGKLLSKTQAANAFASRLKSPMRINSNSNFDVDMKFHFNALKQSKRNFNKIQKRVPVQKINNPTSLKWARDYSTTKKGKLLTKTQAANAFAAHKSSKMTFDWVNKSPYFKVMQHRAYVRKSLTLLVYTLYYNLIYSNNTKKVSNKIKQSVSHLETLHYLKLFEKHTLPAILDNVPINQTNMLRYVDSYSDAISAQINKA